MNRLFSVSYLSLIYFLLYLPIVVLVVFSFNNATFSTLWHGFTFRWYKELIHDSGLQIIAMHSISIALLASTLACIIGGIGAIALYKYRFVGRNALYGLIFIMIIIPDLVLGIALLLLFYIAHLPLGFTSLLLAHITFCIPFVFVTIYGRLLTLDKNLFEAAKDLGATDFHVVWRVMIPLLMPAIVAAWMLSFTLSLDDVLISFFVSGPDFQILPLYIFSQVRLGVTPELNALCTLILLVTLSLAVVSQWFLRRKV